MLDESAEARKSNVSNPAVENADLQRNTDNLDEPQIKSADSRRVETVKAKRAADAAQELAEAVSKFFPNSQPVSMTEVETRAAAWHKANKFPSESDKEFLIEPNPAVSDIALPPPPLPVETMATAGTEDDMVSVASISFSEQHTTQREEEKGRNNNFDEKTLSPGSSDNIVEATLTRSQIAEARRERLQLVQDEMDAKKLRAQAAGKVERARDEVAQRQFLVERARVAAVNMQNQKHQYAMSQTM